MSKPDDISQEVWDQTETVWVSFLNPDLDEVREVVARAILNERNNAAKISKDWADGCEAEGNHDGADASEHISQAIRNGGK